MHKNIGAASIGRDEAKSAICVEEFDPSSWHFELLIETSGDFAERNLWNVAARYSGFAPDNFTTLPHFSVSSAMSLPKSAGEPGSTVPPKSANRAFNLGSASPVLISVLSFPMISGGVFLGAQRPTHWLASKPLTKSPTVGISGSASDRVAVVTAKARSLLALMYSIDAAMSVNVTWICPPSRSVIAGPAPRYGTC